MIVAPDWKSLSGIAAGLDTPDPVARKRALTQTFAAIDEALPDVRAIRVYKLDTPALMVLAATDKPDRTPQHIASIGALDALFTSGISQWLPAEQQWLCPLVVAGEPIGLFEVLVEDLDDEWIAWLEVVATQLGLGLAIGLGNTPQATTADTQLPLKSIATAARMLANTEDYHEAATAAMYMMSEDVTALLITAFDQPFVARETGTEGLGNNRRYVAAFADRQTAEAIQRSASIGPMPELSHINSLRQEVPILLDNPQLNADYLNTWMRDRATALNVAQVVGFALIAADQVVGTLDLYYSEPHTLSQSEVDLYSALANQLAATILSKRLLQRSLEAQAFASQLVTTNKALAVAESYEEMAEAVLADAPASIQSVAIALFNRPFTMMGTPARLETMAVRNREGAVTGHLVDHFHAQEDARITYFLHEFLEGRMMLLWNIQRPRKPVFAEQLVDFMITSEVDQVTAFGLNVRSNLQGLVVFAGDDTLRNPGPQYDGLRAIADQLAAMIENRNLLQQTSNALDLIQSQYETSSRVFRTADLSEILRAVYDFAGGIFDYAELVYTDATGVTRVVAVVRKGHHALADRVVQIDDYPASATLNVLEALEIRNVDEDVFISDAERARLQADEVKSLVILPIVSNFAVNGLILLTSGTRSRVAPDRLRAMRSLADQVGVVLQNRNLLQTMAMNLQEIELLYEANRAMLRTQDIMDVLRVLRVNFAPDATTIALVEIGYASQGRNRITEVMLECEVTLDQERVTHDLITTDERVCQDVYQFLRGLQGNVLFSPQGNTVTSNPLSLMGNRYTYASHVTLLLRERGQVTGLIYLLFDTPKTFPDGTRQLYEAISDQVGIAVEKQKLLRESQATAAQLGDRVRALQIITQLAVEISNIRDERKLLDTSAEALVKALSLDHCGVVLFNEDMQSGVVVSEYPVGKYRGMTVSTKDNPILLPSHDLTKPVVIEDVAQDARLSDTMLDLFQRVDIRSVIIIPLLDQNGDLIGSVGLDTIGKPRTYERTEIQTAQTITAQMGVGLQNVRLLRDAQTRAEQLENIRDFGSVTQSTLELTELVEMSLANVPRLLDVDHMTVALYDETQDALVLVGGWQETNSFRVQLETGGVVPLMGTTTGYVYQTGEYLYIPNFQRANDLAYPHSRTVTSLLAMPLGDRQRTNGVLTIGSHKAAAYTNTDIAVFQQLVNQVAVAMENARAYTQSRELARNKTLTNDIAFKLQRQDDIQQMLNVTLSEVGQALGAKRGRVRLRTGIPQQLDGDTPSAEAPSPPDDPTDVTE